MIIYRFMPDDKLQIFVVTVSARSLRVNPLVLFIFVRDFIHI